MVEYFNISPMNCHACNSKYSTTTKPFGLAHFLCPNCGHRYRMADNAAEYHATVYTARLNAKEPEQRVHNKLIQFIKPYLIECKTVLDIGPGLGLFAQRASAFCDVECVEVNPKFAQTCQDLGFTTYLSDFMHFSTDKQYDAVTIWATLEHFDDINLLMEKMKALSNRFVMFEIPQEDNSDYYIRRFFKPEFRGHHHNFTAKSIKHYIDRHNLLSKIIRKGSRQQCTLIVCEK